MMWMLRRHSTTTMTLWGCDETSTGGVLGVKINGGEIITGDTLGAALNYCGLVTATGLTADTEYSYQLTLGGSDVAGATGTFRTAPAAGSDADLMFVICSLEAGQCFAPMLARETADACYTSEFIYIDESEYNSNPPSAATIPTLRGSSSPTGSSSSMTSANYQSFRNSYRLKHRYSYLREGSVSRRERAQFCRTYPMRMMWDNHEFETETVQPAPGSNQFDGAFQAAYEYYFMGNPPNADADLDTVPTYNDGTDLVAAPAYFREVLADVEVICPDMISYSAATLARRYNDAGRGGTKQLAWINAAIANSTAKFLILFNPQRIDTTNAEWTGAGGLFETINAKNQTVLVITGDIHRPYARLINHATYAPDRPLLDVGASPLRQTSNSDFIDISGQTVYFDPLGEGDNIQTPYGDVYSAAGREACNWIYCMVRSRPNGSSEYAGSHIKVELKNPLTGAVRWSAIIPEGQRMPV